MKHSIITAFSSQRQLIVFFTHDLRHDSRMREFSLPCVNRLQETGTVFAR